MRLDGLKTLLGLCRLPAFLLLLTCASAVAGEAPTAAIAAHDLIARLDAADRPLLVDVRRPTEYAIAHVPGAINIPVEQLPQRLGEVHDSTGVLVYCFNGVRTREAERLLLDNGIGPVYHLEETFEQWLQSGHPVEKGAPPRADW